MELLRRVEIALENGASPVGSLEIFVLPRTSSSPIPSLLDFSADHSRDPAVQPVQLLEGLEYRYALHLPDGDIQVDRSEIFEPDDSSWRRGRLRVGNFTGTIPLTFSISGSPIATCAFEVRSSKIDYLTQYRWMLRDIADILAEVISQRFGTAVQRFEPEFSRDSKSLYQRFAFLQSLLSDEMFTAALLRIVHRPYVAWVEREEEKLVRAGLKGGSKLNAQVSRPGRRLNPNSKNISATLAHKLPIRVFLDQSYETVDNAPNRFVKFALERWRETVLSVVVRLQAENTSPAVRRGILEANQVATSLDLILNAPLFREVKSLTHIQFDNPVLIRKEGYRDVYKAFLQFDLAARLAWKGGEDVYAAGQRNVAALYEYWVYIQLVQLMSEISGAKIDLKNLFSEDHTGLNVSLRRGSENVVTGGVERFGRQISFELWFNKTFSTANASESWTEEMRPDCSIRFQTSHPISNSPYVVWVHFDAKYRIDHIRDLFNQSKKHLSLDGEEARPHVSRAKRSDFLKMHAYRDAIRRSAGSYVVYPGESERRFRQYHEILPGIGAFALRPAANGAADGSGSIKAFIENIVTQISDQTSQYERASYWEREAFAKPGAQHDPPIAADFLNAPPADTTVLLGFVKSEAHWQWIAKTGLYNLRADLNRKGSIGVGNSALNPQVIVLYGTHRVQAVIAKPKGGVLLLTQDDLLHSGYPQPRGISYFCFSLQIVDVGMHSPIKSADVKAWIVQNSPESSVGAPVVTSWYNLVSPDQSSQ